MKRQLSEWEEIFANEATNMALISKTYKQLIELSIKIVNSLIKNWVEDLNRYFSKKKKKDIQMAKEHMNRCSISLILKEIQIKATMTQSYKIYHLTLVKSAIIRKSTNNKYWTGCREKGTLLHCLWESKLVQPLWRIV